MTSMNNLFLNGIYLLFPLSVYLIYLAYIRNMDLKEKSIFLELSLLSSLYLMLRYDKSESLYTIMLFNIPLLLAYIKEKTMLSILISTILIIYYNQQLSLPIWALIIEYCIYLLIHFFVRKKKYQSTCMINAFVIIKSFIISFLLFFKFLEDGSILNNLIYLVYIMVIFTIYSYLIIYLFEKASEIVDLSMTLKELEREKKLRTSISKMTHELKNPIAVCNGYLEMLDINNKTKVKKYIPIIKEEINRSLMIINEFSDFGKIKKIEKEEIDLGFLLEELEDLLMPIYKKNGASLEVDEQEEIYIEADYNRLKQVFVNILKNAIEAKKEEETLHVKVALKDQKHKVKIIITDDGIGMDKETLNHLFEVFYTTKKDGTGLGVAFSKEVIEMHGGSINYKSILNKGTTVTIILPRS